MTEPRYWMHEIGTHLGSAVRRFLEHEESAEDCVLVRAYLRQWIEADVWDRNPFGPSGQLDLLRATVGLLSSRQDFDRWLEVAEHEGMDPL